MDLRLTTEQEQLVETFAAFFAKEAAPDRVREAEPLGHDAELWAHLQELGAVAMAVDEEHGGWGASVLDLALVAEQFGRAVAPAPLLEAQVAARLLARLGQEKALATALDGSRLTTLALRPARGRRAALVPAGAVADDALVLVDDDLVLVPLPASRVAVANLGALPLADVEVPGDAAVLASGAEARALHDAAVDEWATLMAAALVGLGARALEIGVEYTKQRIAWGVPIATFQAVAHTLADDATVIDGARLLAYQAAWAAAEEPGRRSELAGMAFAFAYETARDASLHSLRFHGGYGLMAEYDIQLYFRRARAWAQLFGDPVRAYDRVADARYGERGR